MHADESLVLLGLEVADWPVKEGPVAGVATTALHPPWFCGSQYVLDLGCDPVGYLQPKRLKIPYFHYQNFPLLPHRPCTSSQVSLFCQQACTRVSPTADSTFAIRTEAHTQTVLAE